MALRLRLKFQKHILSESQRLDGLKRSWILVYPQDQTISDLISHLLDTFDLYDSCPNGILLSMDGFVLPPFESTSILKDTEVIWVKRKGAKLVDFIQGNTGETDLLEHNVEQKQQLIRGVQLLANGEFVHETGGYQSDTEEDKGKEQTDVHEKDMAVVDVPVKKRKASGESNVDAVHAKKRKVPKELKSSKKKGRRQASDSDEYVAQKEHGGACLLNGDFEMKSSKDKQDQVCTPEVAGINLSPEKNTAITINLNGEGTVSPCNQSKRSGQSSSANRKKAKRRWLKNIQAAEKEQEEEKADSGSNKEQNLNTDNHQQDQNEDSGTEEDVVRVSRNTKRKKLKRQFLRTIRAAEREQMQSPQEKLKEDSGPNKDKNLNTDHRQQEPDEDSDTDDEVVPVMIRPGHIRFAASGKAKEVEQRSEAKESFSWNGTMNKRKGQKWGSQQQTASKWNENVEKQKWNENRTPQENQSATERNGRRSPKEKQSKSWENDYTVPDGNCATGKVPADNALIDYEKLLPLTDSPVKGDIIAYRLLELSSSFCPELTAYRAGKVSWFDPKSNKILLYPVPQYPFEFKKSANGDGDDEDELPDTSSYNDDGSLEIEFQSLVDVRVVKRGESGSTIAVQHRANGAPASGSGWTTETSKGECPSTQAWPTKINGTRGNNSSASSQGLLETSSSNKASPQPEPISNNSIGANNSAPPNPEKGSNDAWEEITAALSAKKAQLQKEDAWNKNQGGAKRPWSYRAMRSGALGPTLALLRTQNGAQAN